jgi:carboxymethylenebutenolidase
MPEARHFQYNVTVGYITIVADAQLQVPAFWAHPQTGGPFPGLVLLHDEWGLSEHMRAVARRFAEVGYYVIVPDLFDGKRATQQIGADALGIEYKPRAAPKVAAAVRALETHHKCNAKMAVLGWDLGAELAVKIALERYDIMAAVAFYGDLSQFFGHFSDTHCPLLVIFGGLDEITHRTHQPLEAELKALDKPHEVIVYPDAPNGFYNDMQPSYVPHAANDAWVHVLKFLKKHQGEPPPPPDANPGYFRPGRVY